MRPDMNKLLCERERPQSKEKFHPFRRKVENRYFRDPEAGPQHLSPSKIYGGRHSFNENLNPIFQFLRSKVNCKWDDVYSEICKTFDKRSVINQHILDHVGDWIEKNCRVDDDDRVYYLEERKRINSNSATNHNRWLPIEECFAEMYVHPESGILLKTPRITSNQRRAIEKREKLEKLSHYYKMVSPELRYAKLNGVWYEFKMERVINRWVKEKVLNWQTREYEFKDVLKAWPEFCAFETAINQTLNKHGYCSTDKDIPHNHYCLMIKREIALTYNYKDKSWSGYKGVSKRQLSSKEIKKAGLLTN